MSSSKAFSEMLPASGQQSMDDFAILEDENMRMRMEIEEMERVFSQTDNQFFQASKDAMEMESQFSEYQLRADAEIA